jgi:predicted dehydrogenase
MNSLDSTYRYTFHRKEAMNMQDLPFTTSRRQFLKGSAAAGVGGVLLSSMAVPGVYAAGDDVLKVGLIGCGGRGSGAAAQALTADKNVKLTAIGDAFADRLQSSLANLKKQFPAKVDVADDHCFVGFDAYQKVIDSGVDVVILTSPPHFRAQHLKAAVAAGKHIFCEKPVAVDAPGIKSVLATVEEAKKKNLVLVSGLCWRYHYAHRETFNLIHDGALGDITTIYSAYNTGALWNHGRQPEWSDMEWQVRNWLYFTWLSGDHIVEQAVHSIDKMAWARKDVMPVKAIAHGGRQVRTDPAYGHIFDHFEVVYEWADQTRGFLFCRQQEGCANGVEDHIYGTEGVCDLKSGNSHAIRGKKTWKYAGAENNMYQTEHDEMFAAIRAGKPINDGVRMCTSTMMAILGRMAAYTGKIVTWDEAMNSKEDMTPAKYEWGQLPLPPVALPGKTKFI